MLIISYEPFSYGYTFLIWTDVKNSFSKWKIIHGLIDQFWSIVLTVSPRQSWSIQNIAYEKGLSEKYSIQ